MSKLYYDKITNSVMNPATQKAWCIDDIPALWKDEVQAMLDADNQLAGITPTI